MKRRILSIITALTLCLGMWPVTAFAAETGTTYIDANGQSQTHDCTPLTSSSSTALQGGWYVVNGNVTISGTLVFNGETHLVLADGCKLKVQNIETTNLTIYGQSQGTGTLLAGGEYVTAPAIGYADPAGTSPKVSITINGGCVNAYSETSIIAPYSLKRSVIGGYYSNTSANSVTINGGVVYTRDISAEGCSFPPKGPTIHNSIVGHNGVATVYGRAGLPDAGEIGFKAPNNLKSIYISSGATLTSLGKYKAYPIDMYDLPDDFEITLNGTINFASTEQEIRNAIRVTSPYRDIGHTGSFTIAGLTSENVTTITKNEDETCTATFTKNSKTVRKTFSLSKWEIQPLNVTLSMSSYSYTGSAIEPGVTVKVNGKTLTKGTDYTVEYTDNIQIGQGKVTVTGIGNYAGTATVNFTITDADTLIDVQYVDESGQGQTAQAKAISTSNDSDLTLGEGWYFVQGTAERGNIFVKPSVDSHLILPDGCSLNVTKGLTMQGNLTIYGQSGNSGTLTVKNRQTNAASLQIQLGNLTVNGGKLTVNRASLMGPAIAVESGRTFTYNGTSEDFKVNGNFNSSGTLQTERLTEDMIAVDTTNLPRGSSGNLPAEVGRCVSLKNPTYAGKEFALTGWEQSVAKVNDTTYTVTYTHEKRGTVSKTVTLTPPCAHTNLTFQDKGDGTCGGTCPDCNQEVKEPHQWSAAGVCGKCQTQAVAKVEKDGKLIGYYGESNLASAFTTENSGATVTLLSDVKPSNRLTIQIDCTLDLNGHTITCGNAPCVSIQENTAVTIRGEGEIIAKGGTALMVNGSVTLEGGTFTGNGENFAGVYVNSGTLSVTGKKVSIRNTSGGYGLSVAQAQSVRLSAGTYSGTTEAISSIVKLSDMLAHTDNTCYAYYQGDALVTTGLDGQAMTGTVTVKACTHAYQYAHTTGTTAHSQTCPACGDAKASEKCDFSNGPCPCGAVLAVTLPADLNLTYNGTAQEPGVTVTVDGTPLAASNYEVTYADNINAGTNAAKVTVTGKNYTGTTTLNFTIGKATPTIAWANNVVRLTYTGQPADIKPVVTLVNGETFSGTITYHHTNTDSSESGESKAGLPTNAGIYVVGAKIPEQDNYTAAATAAYLTLIINKADQATPAAPSAAEVTDNSITLDAIENAEYKRDGGEWQDSPVFTGLDPNHEYTFYARLKEDRNHNASPGSEGTSITTKKTMLDTAVVTVSGTYTYTGAAIVPEAGNVTVKLGDTTVEFDQYTISASSNVNAGKATLIVTATDNGNYSGSASGSFEIGKTSLTITASAQTITYGGSITTGADQVTATGLASGDTLESVTLEASTSNVPGGTIKLTGAKIQNASGADVTGNYEIAYQPGLLTINKSQPIIAFASGYNPGKTYDGQTIANPSKDDLTITGAAFKDVTFEWSATPKDAGTYTLTASIPETTNTEAAQTAPLTITISPKNVTTPAIELSPSTFVYDGTAKEPTVTIKDGSTVIPDSEYTVEYSNNTNVGTATVIIKDKENGNYTIAQAAGTFTITAKSLTGAKVGVSGSFTYTGSALTPNPVVTLGEQTLVKGTDYTVAYDKNTDAGTATVTVTGKGNYSGTTQGTFTIGRATLTVTGTGTASGTYGDKLSELTVSGLTVKLGDTEISGTWKLTGDAIPNAGDISEHTATFTPATGVNNYNPLTTKVKLNIAKAPAQTLTPKIGDLAVANKQAHTYTFGLGALRPDLTEGMNFGSDAVTYELGAVSLGSYYVEGAEIDAQTLTLPIKAVESSTEDSIGTVTIIIKTGNYENMTATINVRSVNKTIPTGAPTLSAATITYGQPISTITLSGSMMDGEVPVPGTFQWSSPENRPAAQDSYAAAWVFTPTDNEKYAKVNGTSAVKVLPAPIASAVIELKPTAFKYDGSAHKPAIESVKLGEIILTADTDYTAEIPEGTDATDYTVTLTGKGNYTGTATEKFTVNPVEQKPLDKTDEDGHELRLEVETGLSSVPTALASNEILNTPEKITTALQTKVTEVMADAGKQISVLDVTLQYKDESGNWHNVDADNFPDGGITAVLPYPEGTGASGYTFTVQHLISSGDNAGTMETLSYTLTADGLQCKFDSLSPVAIGYKKNPSSGGSSGGGGGGWYPSVSYYSVKVNKTEHGTVTASPTSASSGSTVTLTVKPDDGYKLDKITVTDSQNKVVDFTEKDGKYTFKMPSRDVTIKADFVPAVSPSPEPTGSPSPSPSGSPTPTTSPSPSPKPWKNPFPDVSNTGWYIKAVEYVCNSGLMAGYSNGKFGPNDDLTRAQFAQIIYNKEGRPKADSGRFTDVTTGWYANAVNWAAAEGIVAGIGGGKFAPDRPITRQDLAVMLWRYAGNPEPRKNELDFSDAGKVSTYAWEALCWANENGIVNGKGSKVLDPKGKATRAEAAQMLKNYIEDQKDKS